MGPVKSLPLSSTATRLGMSASHCGISPDSPHDVSVNRRSGRGPVGGSGGNAVLVVRVVVVVLVVVATVVVLTTAELSVAGMPPVK
jgi:hypothetical protein